MRMIRAALALSLATTLANAVPATGQVTVSNAWVRGTVGGQKTSGAFMQLKSSTDVEVVGVATPAAKTAEIHASRSDGGMMRMSHVEKLLAPLPRDCGIVTVIDGHPATLGWLGSVRGHRVEALGVERFGQTGTIDDLYRHNGIDANAIIDAAEALTSGAPVLHRKMAV